jgi:hypothetical protein
MIEGMRRAFEGRPTIKVLDHKENSNRKSMFILSLSSSIHPPLHLRYKGQHQHLSTYLSVISHFPPYGTMMKKSRYSILFSVVVDTALASPHVRKNMHVACMSSRRAMCVPMQPREPAPQSKNESFISRVGLSQRSGLKLGGWECQYEVFTTYKYRASRDCDRTCAKA